MGASLKILDNISVINYQHKKYDADTSLSFLSHEACSPDPILRIRFLVPKIGSKGSEVQKGLISRFRFCDENVGRLFLVYSHNPIFRTNKESSIWYHNNHSDIMQNLSPPFFFQEECQMKIEHVLFPSVFFFQNYGSVCRKVIFNVFVRSDFRNQQKKGSCEQACTVPWYSKTLH